MRRSRWPVLAAAVLGSVFALVAWLRPPASAPDEAGAIRAARLAQNRALAVGDLESAQRYWAPDISVRAGLGTQLQGRDAYRAAFESDGVMRYDRRPTQIVVSKHWPLAFETGTWTGRAAGSVGAPLLSGQYSAQWVRVGSQWEIRAEVFVAMDCSAAACAWTASPP